MSLISVENIRVGFEDKIILDDVSLAIERGEIVTVMGANGCGKSTLLRSILGIQPIRRGKVAVAGVPISEYSPSQLARKVAFLPQSANPPEDMSVEEWVGCGRYPYQKWWLPASDEDRLVVDKCLRYTHVDHLRDRMVQSLSGGERQRVRIAMALAQEPEIIVLDEPTTYLDLCHQLEVMELLKAVNQEENVTVVMVLHDVNHAAKYSTRLFVLANSSVYDSGPAEKVLTAKMMREVYGVVAEIETRDGHPYCFVDGLTEKERVL